jgi:hypothetical protein
MKKTSYLFIIAFIFLAFSGRAFADYSFNTLAGDPINSPQPLGTYVELYCSLGDNGVSGVFHSNGTFITRTGCSGNTFLPVDYSDTIQLIACDMSVVGSDCTNDDTILAYTNDAGYTGELGTFTTTKTISEGIFYSRDITDHTSTANGLVASVATATGATFGSLGDIVAVVLGILLAFVFIRYIVEMIRITRENNELKHKDK